MKKLVISVTFITCLVLPGFLGSVYGQIDTLIPGGFLNQDRLRVQIELDNSPDIYSYHNKSHNNFNQIHKNRPTNFGYGSGIYYQLAWYSGNISDFISDHRVFYYPLVNIDFYFKKFVLQFFSIGNGTFTANSVNINGDIFKGNFFGELYPLDIALGYEVFSNSFVSIIPNIGFHSHDYTVKLRSGSSRKGHGNTLTEFTVNTYSFGFNADYKLLKIGSMYNIHFSFRIKYDYCLTAKQDEYYNGRIHQFTLGPIFTVRGK